jgi:tetratricopeptide (TPR) repeat protein
MPEIETALFDAGWTAEPRRIREAAELKMTSEEQTFVLLHPHHLETAAILTKYNRLDDAAAIYRNNLEKFRAALVREPDNAEARSMLISIALQFGLLAKKFVLAGLFSTALECLNDLVSVAPDNLPLQAAYAHALMFIGKRDEAEQIYLQHRGKQVAGERWEDIIDNDFSQLHHARRTDPLMDSIRRRFAFDNEIPIVPQHATPSSPARAIAKPSQDPPIPDLANSDTVAAGDQLVLENRLDEAVAVYRRRLNICAAKLINGRVNMQALDDRQHVLDALSDVAFGWIRDRQPQKALDVADEALAVLAKTASANVRRAHALMLLNRPQEARAVYQLYWNAKASPDKTWKDAIRDDFAVMRSWDITHSLMEELDPTQVRPRKLIR